MGGFIMKKYLFAAVFLVLLVVSLTGTVSADATIDTYYIDEDGNEITTAPVGSNVEYLAEVQNDETSLEDATVEIDVNSNVGMENIEYFTSMDGGINWQDNPLNVNRVGNTIIWDIGPLNANQLAMLNIHGTVTQPGVEVLTATLEYVSGQELIELTSVATLTVTAPSSASNGTASAQVTGKTVPMQKTGTPLAFLALAVGLISAGLAYSRKQ
jgi:hypothetical protein